MRATTVDEVVAHLRAGGSRFTAQRRTIVEALFSGFSCDPGDEHHLTADDVCARVQRIDPSIHRASVYRTLDLLVEHGVLDEVQPGQRPTVYHLPAAAHVHLVCEGCGSVGEAPLDVVGGAAARLEDEHGFTLRRDGLVLRGRCAACT